MTCLGVSEEAEVDSELRRCHWEILDVALVSFEVVYKPSLVLFARNRRWAAGEAVNIFIYLSLCGRSSSFDGAVNSDWPMRGSCADITRVSNLQFTASTDSAMTPIDRLFDIHSQDVLVAVFQSCPGLRQETKGTTPGRHCLLMLTFAIRSRAHSGLSPRPLPGCLRTRPPLLLRLLPRKQRSQRLLLPPPRNHSQTPVDSSTSSVNN